MVVGFGDNGGVMSVWMRVVAVVVTLGCLWGCAKPKPTLVVVVGGLGLSQLGDVRRAVEKKCPEVDVVNAGGWDGYKADLKRIALEKGHRQVMFVGHSFGCEAIADAAAELPAVDLAIFIDPSWDDFKLPRTVGKHLWFKRSGLGIERSAKIVGANHPVTIQGGHNDIPHSEVLIAGVVQAINRVQQEKLGRRVLAAGGGSGRGNW